MTIKLNSLGRWKELEASAVIQFERTAGERRIRLHLNLEAETVFFLEDENGPRFLTTVPAGVETLEFNAAGGVAVFPAEGSGRVMFQTAEGEPTFSDVVDPVVFTKIAQRRHRNPELERMMFVMNQNLERRLAMQAAEFEAALARGREGEEINAEQAIVPDATGAAAEAGSGAVQSQEPSTGESLAGTGGADGGEGAGGGEPPAS